MESQIKSTFPGLGNLHFNLDETEKKMNQFTMLKCKLSRDINTCTTEYIYFESRTKEILQATLECVHKSQAQNNSQNEELCYKSSLESFNDLKSELNHMIQTHTQSTLNSLSS
ncbi:unnamed protein product [Moneuplotes crassus]|uniref:Uncharacterized protein n=1 Tax=Euplotes crassus TaxID=5936 RepID=A0AAD2D6P9_EUPCR|nr:unnamed protein product [Moneuplotes crassus]